MLDNIKKEVFSIAHLIKQYLDLKETSERIDLFQVLLFF